MDPFTFMIRFYPTCNGKILDSMLSDEDTPLLYKRDTIFTIIVLRIDS